MPGNWKPATVERVHDLYVDSELSLTEISAAVKLSKSTIYEMREHFGWPKRSDRPDIRSPQRNLRIARERGHPLKSKIKAEDATRGPEQAPRRPADQATLVQRLFDAIDETLREIEPATGDEKKKRPSHGQRTSAIATMVRSLEKVLEMKVAQAKANGTTGQAAEKVRQDADDLRQTIAERLAQLQRKRDACK